MTIDTLSSHKLKNKSALNSIIIKAAIFLASIFAYEGTQKVSAQTDTVGIENTLIDRSNQSVYNYAVYMDFLNKFDLRRGYESRVKGTQGEIAGNVTSYPEVFTIKGTTRIQTKSQFIQSFYNPNVRSAAAEQAFSPAYYIDFAVNQKERAKKMSDTLNIENKEFYELIVKDRGLNKSAPQQLRLYFYKRADLVVSSLKTMPFTIFGEAYSKTIKTYENGMKMSKEQMGAISLAPREEIPLLPRETFVAYGHRISHDDCKPGAHVGDGHQSQQCGKLIKIKSYHRKNTGAELTPQEQEKYIKNDEVKEEIPK